MFVPEEKTGKGEALLRPFITYKAVSNGPYGKAGYPARGMQTQVPAARAAPVRHMEERMVRNTRYYSSVSAGEEKRGGKYTFLSIVNHQSSKRLWLIQLVALPHLDFKSLLDSQN